MLPSQQRRSPPAVVAYSAYVDHVFAVPAAIAQADAAVAKTAPVEEVRRRALRIIGRLQAGNPGLQRSGA